MVFKEYKFGCWRKEIKSLLRERLKFKAKINYYNSKIERHKKKVEELKKIIIPKLDKELKVYLKRAGN